MAKPIPPSDVAITSNPPALTAADWYDFFRELAALVNALNVPVTVTVTAPVTLTYGAIINTNAALGTNFILTITSGSNFAMAAPTNPTSGQVINYMFRNASGGGTGSVTWNAVFKVPSVPANWSPANGFSRSVEFIYDGTNWVNRYGSTDDVPN